MEKFKKRAEKYNINWFLLAALMYAFNAGTYFIINHLPLKVHYINMAVDGMIPFNKYSLIFYAVYYFIPVPALWLLSFRDKDKVLKLVVSAFFTIVICDLCFIIYQVQMVRQPGYPMDIRLSDVRSVSDFFDFGVSLIYKADDPGTNSFPSIHAVIGTMMTMLGLKLSKGETAFSPVLRVLAVIAGVGLVASTVFMKQHYLIDALVGALLYAAVYAAVAPICGKRFGKRFRAEKVDNNPGENTENDTLQNG